MVLILDEQRPVYHNLILHQPYNSVREIREIRGTVLVITFLDISETVPVISFLILRGIRGADQALWCLYYISHRTFGKNDADGCPTTGRRSGVNGKPQLIAELFTDIETHAGGFFCFTAV